MRKLWKIFKLISVIWGSFCFILLLVIVGQKLSYLSESKQTASKNDVRYILNWCELGDNRIKEVIHSYISPRSFTGDHLDAHAIRISHVDINELEKKDDFGRNWCRGDKAEGVFDDAIESASAWLHDDNISWFPKESELRSSELYVYSWQVHYHGTTPTSATLIFVRPKDNMLFYINFES